MWVSKLTNIFNEKPQVFSISNIERLRFASRLDIQVPYLITFNLDSFDSRFRIAHKRSDAVQITDLVSQLSRTRSLSIGLSLMHGHFSEKSGALSVLVSLL